MKNATMIPQSTDTHTNTEQFGKIPLIFTPLDSAKQHISLCRQSERFQEQRALILTYITIKLYYTAHTRLHVKTF
jgi:hypothetical protein